MKKRVNHKSGELLDGEDLAGADRQFAVALSRGLDVLRCFQPNGEALGDKELARRTGLPKTTLARLTHTLCQLGYLDREVGDGAYRLGIGLLSLGFGSVVGHKIVGPLQPFMDEMAHHAGEGVMVALGRRDDLSMVYMACTRNAGMVTMQMNVGSRISLARTSMGRAFLAALPPTERSPVIERIAARMGPERWPDIEREINQAQADIREQGFCCNLGSWRPDVHSVGVPFNIPQADLPPLAFNCGGPSYLLPRERLEQDLGPRLVEMVRRVTALCVGGPPPHQS